MKRTNCILVRVFWFQFLFILVGKCMSANILFTFFHDKGSHFQSMFPMMENLAKRGHSVTVLDTVYAKDQSPLIHHVRAQLPVSPANEEEKRHFADMVWNKQIKGIMLTYLYLRCDRELGTLMQNHSRQFTDLLNTDWDLIVVDDLFWAFGFAMATFKHRMWEAHGKPRGKEPHIVVYGTAQVGLETHEAMRAGGRHLYSRAPICPFAPTDASDVFSPSRISHRIFALYEFLQEQIGINYVAERFLMPNIAKFGVPEFTWHEFLSRSHLFLYDTIDRLGLPRAGGIEMISVGAHCRTPKSSSTLPSNFKQFMEDPSSKGTIYIAFGTHIDWKYAPDHMLAKFIGAFRRLGAANYRIIFVCNECKMPEDLAKTVLILKWAPQMEILAHPSTKAFITHGGNKSIREGLCAGVPLIVMPVYAEQAHTAHLLLKTGVASVINKFTVGEENLFQTINEVVSRPESLSRSNQIRELLLDRPIPAMEEGILAMERLLRDRSGKWREFTQRRGMMLGWPEFGHFDLMALLLVVMAIICS